MITLLTPVQSNVLIDSNGHARITDIGLALITQTLDFIRSGLDDQGYTARWTAPEILDKQETCSKSGDIFSIAMVMVEVGRRRYILRRVFISCHSDQCRPSLERFLSTVVHLLWLWLPYNKATARHGRHIQLLPKSCGR